MKIQKKKTVFGGGGGGGAGGLGVRVDVNEELKFWGKFTTKKIRGGGRDGGQVGADFVLTNQVDFILR